MMSTNLRDRSRVGYILTLLNQCYFYESLNWFDSVSVKYEQEIEQIREEQRLAQRRKDESYAQTLTMKISQIEDLQREFQYLMCTVQSALRFFKQKDSEENQEESYLEEF
uniref:WASH complex subunit 7 C-terminal domain-containing protein n=1 Tax=Acrobeloides nanus TaxID=290746 RepID=A0A914DDX3_9BILA